MFAIHTYLIMIKSEDMMVNNFKTLRAIFIQCDDQPGEAYINKYTQIVYIPFFLIF